jgi:hypothetical protein
VDKDGLLLVASSPLCTFELSPLPFFDARLEGVKPCVKSSPRIPGEDSPILGFVRTPDGQCVGVIRENGGDIWRISEGGSQLSRITSWSMADLIVVLDNGMGLEHVFLFSLLTIRL